MADDDAKPRDKDAKPSYEDVKSTTVLIPAMEAKPILYFSTFIQVPQAIRNT